MYYCIKLLLYGTEDLIPYHIYHKSIKSAKHIFIADYITLNNFKI